VRRLLPLLLAAFAAQAAAQNTNDPSIPGTGTSDWETRQAERDWQEGEIRLPAPPAPEGLIEFFVSAASRFRFFIDAPSLSVGPDGVVRYTLVARSPAGAENVSFEGIRCKSGAFKVYAFAHAGKWSRAASDWKPIEAKSVQRWHNELRGRYFCPLRLPILSAAEGLDALRRGGHPLIPASDQRR